MRIPLFFVFFFSSILAFAYPPHDGSPGPNDLIPEPAQGISLICATFLVCELPCSNNSCALSELKSQNPSAGIETLHSSTFKSWVNDACGVEGNTSYNNEYCAYGREPSCDHVSSTHRISEDKKYCVEIRTQSQSQDQCDDGYVNEFQYYNYNSEPFFGSCDREPPECLFPVETEFGKSCDSDDFEEQEENERKSCPDGYASISAGGHKEGCVLSGENDAPSDACPTGYYFDKECTECVAYGSVAVCDNTDQNKEADEPDEPGDPDEVEGDKPLDYSEFWKYQAKLDRERNNALDASNQHLKRLASETEMVNTNLNGIGNKLDAIADKIGADTGEEPGDGEGEGEGSGICDPTDPTYYECLNQVSNMPDHVSSDVTTIAEANSDFIDRINSADLTQALTNFETKFSFDGGSCPSLFMDLSNTLINGTISTELHCDVMESIKPYISLLMTAIFLFLGFRVFASA